MHEFPDHKRFAFTIFDDTDRSTVENVSPVYQLLSDLGMHTTKSVWPLASVREGWHGGSSLQDAYYLEFILELKSRGYEIGLHNVRNHHSTRQQIVSGLDTFRQLVGHYPRVHANHSRNRENIYWGESRFNTLRSMYRAATALGRKRVFEGEDPDAEYFWGDLCRQRVDYVRNFVFRQINLDHINPTLPYHDPTRPYVKHWFSSCEGANVNSFCDMVSERNQERLEEEGGVCIMYTHFACGFVNGGAVGGRVRELLRALSKRNGWFVPVSQLLDHLRNERGDSPISAAEISCMERRWVLDKMTMCAKEALHVHPEIDVPVLKDSHAQLYQR